MGEGETKERILAAAERVFSEHGYGGARTRQIADAAGVNVGLLHYHFGSKDDLYQAVLRSAQERVAAAIHDALTDDTPPAERIANAIRAHFDQLSKSPYRARLLMDAILRRHPQALEMGERAAGSVAAEVLRAVQDGAQAGVFRDVDLRHTILSATGLTLIYFAAVPIVEALFPGDPYGPDALAARREAVVDLVLHGVLARREPPPEEAS